MAISPVMARVQGLSFKGEKTEKQNENLPVQPQQPQVIVVKQSGGVGAGLLSAVCPGLGQLLDGRPLAGLGWFVGVNGSILASFIIPALFKSSKVSGALLGLGVLGSIGLYVANITNAARGRKASEQIRLNA